MFPPPLRSIRSIRLRDGSELNPSTLPSPHCARFFTPKPDRPNTLVASCAILPLLIVPVGAARPLPATDGDFFMAAHDYNNSDAIQRGARMLRTALGPVIAGYLEDPAIVEVMLNPDGRLWVDRLKDGLCATDKTLIPADGERIVRLVAHHVGAEVHSGNPRVSAELPETGERFEGLLPPVVTAPAFAIRKPAVAVFTLADYVASGVMTESQAEVLRLAVERRKNILVAGGTSTGKTTLTNALLAEITKTFDRVVLIEDTRELQCAAQNLVALRTKDGVASLSDLVKSSLRLRPDRIPIGEVRGAEALDLLKAWGTGHPGGIGTIHASSALGALRRLEQLVQEAVVTVPRALIAETVDLVAVLAGRGSARRLVEVTLVEGLDPTTNDYRLLEAKLEATPNTIHQLEGIQG
jgi:type IV secretion system protein TrbB